MRGGLTKCFGIEDNTAMKHSMFITQASIAVKM